MISTRMVPTYKVVKQRLGRAIARNWKSGSRLPTIGELSRQLGAGQRSMLLAVQEMVTEGTLVSRRGAGTYVTDRFDPLLFGVEPDSDRPLENLPPAGSDSLVGRAVVFIGEPFLTRTMQRISDELVRRGAAVARKTINTADPLPPPWLDEIPVDLVVMFQPDETAIPLPASIPMLVVSTIDLVCPGRSFDLISVDQRQGSMLAGQRLRAAGCEQACFIGVVRSAESVRRDQWDSPSRERLSGFEMGFGKPVAPEHRLSCAFHDMGEGSRMAAQYARLNPRPLGVFCASDDVATGFLHGALAFGLEPGADYKLIGFDGQERGQLMSEGPLTTVAVPVEEMGRRGAELAIRRLLDPQGAPHRLYLGCSLLEGLTVELTETRAKVRAHMRDRRARLSIIPAASASSSRLEENPHA